MKLGAVFPQTEIGADPKVIKHYVQSVETLGFASLLIYDHVLGADHNVHSQYIGKYSLEDTFHEPFVLFGYLAAFTKHLELTTNIIILGQRQTALVAKQAAQVDILTGGRLSLGIGTGWNAVEYEALGENFHDRGIRSEEQIEVLRALWTSESIDYTGRWHRIHHAGLRPLPVQKPIPIWFGGNADKVLRRTAKIGDGWFPQYTPRDRESSYTTAQAIATLKEYTLQTCRDWNEIGIEGRVTVDINKPDEWKYHVQAWEELGATHVSAITMKLGLGSIDRHLETLEVFKQYFG